MMYVTEPSRTQLLDDVRKFIQAKNNKEQVESSTIYGYRLRPLLRAPSNVSRTAQIY